MYQLKAYRIYQNYRKNKFWKIDFYVIIKKLVFEPTIFLHEILILSNYICAFSRHLFNSAQFVLKNDRVGNCFLRVIQFLKLIKGLLVKQKAIREKLKGESEF